MPRCAKVLIGVVVVFVVLGIIGALFGDDEDTTPRVPATPTPGISASADFACTHYFNVYKDMETGLLTMQETLEKHREVMRDAEAASEPLGPYAREMVAAVIADDLDRYVPAATEFLRICNEAYGQ